MVNLKESDAYVFFLKNTTDPQFALSVVLLTPYENLKGVGANVLLSIPTVMIEHSKHLGKQKK